MALNARIDRIATDDMSPVEATVSPMPGSRTSGQEFPATFVCRLTGAVLSAERAQGYRDILNAGGSNAKFLLLTKLYDLVSACTAAGLTMTAFTAVMNLGNAIDPAFYTVPAEITALATRMTNNETGNAINVAGQSHS